MRENRPERTELRLQRFQRRRQQLLKSFMAFRLNQGMKCGLSDVAQLFHSLFWSISVFFSRHTLNEPALQDGIELVVTDVVTAKAVRRPTLHSLPATCLSQCLSVDVRLMG